MKKLGVLLCYNDADFLRNAVESLLNSQHDVIVWDHGSEDDTPSILEEYRSSLVELKTIPRSFDFYKMYPHMSNNLIQNFVKKYDWISWPDQDEILEGPSRGKTYEEYVQEVYEEGYDYICFNNINFWFTSDDDISLTNAIERVKHYSIFPDCSPRVRSWRASSTNQRRFNHNPAGRYRYPINFNLRHYPMRSREQMYDRLMKSRANLKRGNTNTHYESMKAKLDSLEIGSDKLHFDNGEDLKLDIKFDWRLIYGFGPTPSVAKKVISFIKRKL